MSCGPVEVTAEHRWLQRLVGEWTMSMVATMDPTKPPETCTGSEVVRSLGGIWMVGEGRMPGPDGGEAQSVMTLGYDPVRKRFQGTFIVSMMTHLWIYDGGTLDAAGKVLTLEAEGPGPDGKTARFRDFVEFLDDDTRTLSSAAQGPDGTWTKFMTATYRRKT